MYIELLEYICIMLSIEYKEKIIKEIKNGFFPLKNFKKIS